MWAVVSGRGCVYGVCRQNTGARGRKIKEYCHNIRRHTHSSIACQFQTSTQVPSPCTAGPGAKTQTHCRYYSPSPDLPLSRPSVRQHWEGGEGVGGGRGKRRRKGGWTTVTVMAGLCVYIAVPHSAIHLAFWGHSPLPEGKGGEERDLFGREERRGSWGGVLEESLAVGHSQSSGF